MSKPNEIKHLEIKEYVYKGISVLVRIDHDNEQVSLMQKEGNGWINKQWVFAKREIEYQQGWLNILDAMKYAIDEAFKELKQTLDRKEREKIALMRTVQEK